MTTDPSATTAPGIPAAPPGGGAVGLQDLAVTADAVASAVRRCPAVAELSRGGTVHVATFLPGHRVDGVQIDDERVLVSVVAVYGTPLVGVTQQIRTALAPLVGARRVDVHIADVQLPGEEPPALPAGPSPGDAPPAPPGHFQA